MVIQTTDYAAFHTMVGALLTTPAVFGNTNVRWFAMAIETAAGEDKLAITCSLDAEPAAFATDYPGHIDTAGPFDVA